MDIGNKPAIRSPLKEKPLRAPGQSLTAELYGRSLDLMGLCLLCLFILWNMAAEWLRWYSKDNPHPIPYTFIAIAVCSFCFPKIRRMWQERQDLLLGRDGERIIGEHLDELRKQGYEVLHDIVGGNFNIDHVLIGATGVYVVETKTRSKSGGQEERVYFDGKEIMIHDRVVEPNPIDQAKANARFIKETLKASTGKDFPVWPIVVYPGWYVEQKAKSGDAWVLNPKNIAAALKGRTSSIPHSDVSLAAFHLKRFIRSIE